MKSRSNVEFVLLLIKNFINNNFIYYVNNLTNLRRLCNSAKCVKKVLNIAHDNEHFEFDRCFKINNSIQDLIHQRIHRTFKYLYLLLFKMFNNTET